MRYLADQVLGEGYRHPGWKPTLEAEAALDLGRCMYWYIGCAIEEYLGEAGALWEPSGAIAVGDGGLCPFDSGGLWHRKFSLDPPLTSDNEVVSYFQECDRSLQAWPDCVWEALAAGWDDNVDYARGEPPVRQTTPSFHGGHSRPHAWVWEGRLRSDTRVAERIEIADIYWDDSHRRRFFAWLGSYGGFSSDQRRQVGDTVAARGHIVPDLDLYPTIEGRLVDLIEAP
jgi:hypothetical protein